jgi:DNA-binding NtrC family response regulator
VNDPQYILVGDDDPTFVAALSPLLLQHGRVQVARTVECAFAALVERAHLRAVLVSFCLPGDGSGLDVIAEVGRSHPGTPTALFGGCPNLRAANAAYLAGADYLEKPIDKRCIERFMNVRLPLAQRIEVKAQGWQERHHLSRAEKDILCRAALGESRETIAAFRSSSPLTVKRQVADLLQKTGDESLHAAIERLTRELVET